MVLDVQVTLWYALAMLVETNFGIVEIEAYSRPLPGALAVVLPVARRIGVAAVVDLICPIAGQALLSHGEAVEFLILNILNSQRRAPLYKLNQWAADNHVELLYGQPASCFNDDRIGRALDAISEHIAEIETAVVSVALQQFNIDARRIHWDFTNVTFSDARDESDLVCRGYGNGRLHDRQVQLGLNATGDGGIPVRHETLPGSANQTPLGPEMLADLQRRLGRADLIIISDRAGFCYDTIAAYRRAKAHFVGPLQVREPQQAVMEATPLDKFRELSYRSMNAPDDASRAYRTTLTIGARDDRKPRHQVDALIIHTDSRAREDAKERDKHLKRASERLDDIGGKLNARRYARADYARGQLEKAVPASVAQIVRWELSGVDKALSLRHWIDPEALEEAIAVQGRYILIYDLPGEATPDEVFEMYKDQHQIESRFRNLGSDLGISPIWLQKDNRIAALALVFVLALIVYTLLELCSVRAGLEGKKYHKLTARALLEQMTGVHLQVVRARGSPPSRELRVPAKVRELVRSLGFPDPATWLC